MDFRTKIKKEIASQVFKIETNTSEELLEKNELGLRLLKFFEYEQDPEFEQWFTKFCSKRKWKEEREKDINER